jgi:AraC-like DNA-binding protein
MRSHIPRWSPSTRLTKRRARTPFDRSEQRETRIQQQTVARAQSPKKEKEKEKAIVDHLPDFDQRLYPVQKLAAVVAVLAEDGVPASKALRESELTPADLQSPSTRISYRQTITVFNNAIRLSKDSTTAIRAGQRMHITSYGMYGYALLSCPTHAAAAKFVNKYIMAIGPTFSAKISLDEQWARYQLFGMISQDPTSNLYQFALDFSLAMFLTQYMDLFERPHQFSHLRIACPPPAHASIYGDLFQCPVFFNADINEIQFPAANMAEPIACADPITHDLARKACEDILKEAERSSGLTAAVRQALLRVPNRFPPAESIAVELGLSPRQLHRNLQAENTSYRKILDEARMGLAIAYLRKTRITTDDIAIRLGYSDGANFRHAFRRWTGKNTSEYRNKGV